MYKCRECNHEFIEPKEYSEDCTPSGVFESGSFIRIYSGCPLCSGNYEEIEGEE